MSRRESFRQSNWLIELPPRKNVDPRIVGIRSTFRGSTFFRLVEIRLKRLYWFYTIETSIKEPVFKRLKFKKEPP